MNDPNQENQPLERFKKSLMRLQSTREVCGLVIDFLGEYLAAGRIGIYLWDEQEGAFTVWPRQERVIEKIMVYDRLLIFLTDQDRIFSREELLSDTPEVREIRNEAFQFFSGHPARLLIPLILNQSMVGMVFVEADHQILPEPLKSLNDVRAMIAMALSNSIIYSRLEGLLTRLEEKVRERTRELENAQSQLIQSEKMAMLGIMTAGIAHEINTPAGVIRAGTENVEKNLLFLLRNLNLPSLLLVPEKQSDFIRLLSQLMEFIINRPPAYVKDAFRRKKTLEGILTEMGIVRARDLAVFFVENGLVSLPEGEEDTGALEKFPGSEMLLLIQKVFAGLPEDEARSLMRFINQTTNLVRNFRNIRNNVDSLSQFARALKNYSHPDQGRMAQIDIHVGLENTIVILRHILKQGIRIRRQYGDLPAVKCNPDELNQVWTNLINNASQALRETENPEIVIRTQPAEMGGEPAVEVQICDNGHGIDDDVMGRIWDPFFTTRDQGEGTGLGLGIVRSIVERHGGQIEARSTPGEMTVFSVRLPVKGK